MKSCVSDLGTRETALLGRPLDLSETRRLGRGEGDGDGVTVMATVTVTVHGKGKGYPNRSACTSCVQPTPGSCSERGSSWDLALHKVPR